MFEEVGNAHLRNLADAGVAKAEATAAAPAPREPLMLPAPVVLPVLPGINTIEAQPAPPRLSSTLSSFD